MTWLQILYVVALYFGLAEVLFAQTFSGYRNSSLFSDASNSVINEPITVWVIVVVVVLLWPVTYVTAVLIHRKQKVEEVITRLEHIV